MIESSFGGIQFTTGGGPFTLGRLEGWHGGPSVRSEVLDRPEADGAFGVVRVYKGARVITQTGLIVAESAGDARGLWRRLSSVQADGRPSEFKVVDSDDLVGELSASVALAAPPTVTPLTDTTASYMVQLVARDPVLYGPAVTVSTGLPVEGGGLEYPLGDPGGALFYGAAGSSGRMTLVNDGTAEVWPVFTVSGALADGFELRCVGTGERVRYSRVVPAGSTVTVDAGAGSVLIDGVSDGSTYLTAAEFFPVPAGGSCEVQFSAVSTGDGSVVASVRSGWW